jgi:predicted permease
MKHLRRIESWLPWRWRRGREAELERELRDHLDLEAEEQQGAGVSPEEAEYTARRALGNTVKIKEDVRMAWGFQWLETLLQDLRYGLRQLRRNPGFTIVAILTLALGIGANTAIFTLSKAALLDSLSVPHPEQLRLLAYAQDDRSAIFNSWGDFYIDAQGRTVLASFSWPVYEELQRKDHSLGNLFAFVDLSQFEHLSATVDGHAEVVSAELVSGNFFQGMGVGTVLGRPIEPADDATPVSGAVAVISDAFWQRQFGRSPSVLGKTLDVNLTPVMIIGVAPPSFTGASRVQTPQDLFLPLSMQPVIFPRHAGSLLSDEHTWWIQIMGRLKPGISDEAARASLAVTLNQATRSTLTVPKDRTVPPLLLLPGGRGWNYTEQELEHPMPLLLALAGLVLLLACVNVANLLLAGFSSRRREISVRMAIGAGKMRVVRQMLTESLCLSALGGTAGLLLGYTWRGILPRVFSASWGPVALNPRFDWRVFAFTFAISNLTGIGFGVGPAWQAGRTSVNAGLKENGTTVMGRRKGFAGKALVVVQVSLCMLLLVSAGLFVRTLANLKALSPGFDKKGLLLFAIEPPEQRYPAPKNVELLHRIEERLTSLPSVESVTLSSEALLAQSTSNSNFIPESRPNIPGPERHIPFNAVGQSFFKTMSVPILYGRAFDLSDTSTSPGVAVISRALAQKEFGAENPVGTSFRMNEGGARFEIVGVCADAKYAWIRDETPPTFYVLYTQQKDAGTMTYEVRTKGDPRDSVSSIREVVESVDKDLPLIEVRTQQEQIDADLAPERSFAILTTGFGILALVLASIGVYGVIAAGVSRRINEIGIRMALGAQRREVLMLVVGQGFRLTVIGVAIGIAGALALTRFLASLLYGVKATDPVTFFVVSLVLATVALIASYIPARRATKVDPTVALRWE